MTTRQDVKRFQSAFRIEGKRLEGGTLVPSKPFVSRKAHTKSRNGCQQCRKRKIKCSEKQPACDRCAKAGLSCVYQDSLPQRSSEVIINGEKDRPLCITSQMHSMAIQSAQTDLDILLSADESSPDAAKASLGTFRMLQHFQAVVSSALGCSRTNHAMQSFVASTAWDFPYLMHMVLTISNAHRRRFNVDDCFLAEVTHWRKGLQLHRENLMRLEQDSREVPWDALISTTFLSIMYTFSIDDDGVVPISLLSEAEYRNLFAPMEATAGFRSLFSFLRGDAQPRSQWLSIMMQTDDNSRTFTCEDPGTEGIPRSFQDLFEIDVDSTVDNNAYHKIVRGLVPLLELEPGLENFPIFFAFLGRTWKRFRPLVYGKDPRGLLLLSYWLALLQQLDQWWLQRKAQRLLDLLVEYLWQVGDSKIHALLPSLAKIG